VDGGCKSEMELDGGDLCLGGWGGGARPMKRV